MNSKVQNFIIWKRNAKKAKWLSGEALQTAMKRKKREKQRRKGKI